MERIDEARKELSAALGDDAVCTRELLCNHTTFRIGGPADVFVRPSTVQQVADVVRICRRLDVPCRVLGCGSNVLACDNGVRGVVMEIRSNLSAIEVSGNTVRAQAGAENRDVAEAACAAGLAGYEFACGIPGTVGGAAVMNAGAYEGEFSHVAAGLTCVTPEGCIVEVGPHEAGWSYRRSKVGEDGYIVVGVALRLHPDDPAAIRARMDDLDRRRAQKQPLELPSAGSTFKRPEGHYVGKLVQDAGLRGYRVGDAQVSEKHTGFVVNVGDATAEDVRGLIGHVQRSVREAFGVELEPEVRMWGFDDGEDSSTHS